MRKWTLTIPPHTHGQALHKPAVLAPVPLALVHLAVLVPPAQVPILLADGALEEYLAALTAHGSVVAPCQVR